jgi:ubiquinone/menaquinone biosynthesis C-methylase UbiE
MRQYGSLTVRTYWAEQARHLLGKLLFPQALVLYADLDWDQEARSLQNPDVSYPSYYLVPHHGVKAGYLSCQQPFSWEFIETLFGIQRIRPALLAQMEVLPARHIVDLGCGNALTSIALARRKADARLTLIDLSPYQLVAARQQVRHYSLTERTQIRHARAEETGLPDGEADLVMASLLFHELPHQQAQLVIREAHRILSPGGYLLLFDAIQQVVPWPIVDAMINSVLATLMHEVYWREYMQQPLWLLCEEEGFIHIERRLLFALPWIYQIVIAQKNDNHGLHTRTPAP